MNQRELGKFIDYLRKSGWQIFGPVKSAEKITVAPVKKISDLFLGQEIPFYPFKRFFVPEQETLFEYRGDKFKEKKESPKIALLGINLLDLKAINLYDQVFEKDAYYQSRRKNILIIGHSFAPGAADNLFEQKFEEDTLEHLPFDIFLADTETSGQNCHVFSGSIKGQRILDHFGCRDFDHVQYAGPVKENQPDERMSLLRDRLKNHHNPKIWEELGSRCIECGKCTLACPTCFCFRIDDQPGLKNNAGERNRCWDSCYYREFSEVAGGHKFLSDTARRIHFWYYHKFARIPDEFGFVGCVGCKRCAKVCPVNIDITKVLESVEKDNA